MDFDLNIPIGLEDFEESEFQTEDVKPQSESENSFPLSSETINHDSQPCDAFGDITKNEDEGEIPTDQLRSLDFEEKLRVGKLFDELANVSLLYYEYAHCKGFSVRKGDQRYIGQTKELRLKEYVCSAAGAPDCKKSKDRVPCYRKNITRTGCKAKIKASRCCGGLWKVTVFEIEHNHTLYSVEQAYLLRSSRHLSDGKKSILEALYSSGIGITSAYRFMEKESMGPQNVGFTKQDAYDHVKHIKRKTKLENGDASAILDYLSSKSNEESRFYYKLELDDDGRLLNFFFRDSRCADDFVDFGDVLSVDTTYRTDRYNLICAPFVGINHHASTQMFGMAFLSDETTSTFEWLFKSFLESMNGKEPKIIFTNQCKALMNAADSCFPNAKHRLCQWHINQNAPSHFGLLNGNKIFKRMWHSCMNGVETEEEFEDLWSDMINGFKLNQNRWFSGIYCLWKRWASVFTNDVFSGGLLATSRSEGTNRVLKTLCQSSGSLYEFVCNYEKIQTRWREQEHVDDTNGLWTPGQFVNGNPLLSQAASVYTKTVYKAFEKEDSCSYNVELREEGIDLGDGNFQYDALSSNHSERSRTVIYNSNTNHASCSCHMFEREGIFCRHILKVYYNKNVRSIPDPFILKRWSKRAKIKAPLNEYSTPKSVTMPTIVFANSITRSIYKLATDAKLTDSSRDLLRTRVDNIRKEFQAKFGLGASNSQPGGSNGVNIEEKFSDPKPVRQRGFINARTNLGGSPNLGHWDRDLRKRKGNKRRDLTSFGFKSTKKRNITKQNGVLGGDFDIFTAQPSPSSSQFDAEYPLNFSQP